MKDTFGGVQNVWYVSPALFPIFISIGIIILGIVLLINSIKEGGAKTFFEKLAHIKLGMSEGTLRFLSIVLVLVAFVYLNIPRIDFFLSAMLCLTVFISMYYLDYGDLLKRFTTFYAIGNLIFVLLFVFGIGSRLNMGATDVFINKLIVMFRDGAFASGNARSVESSERYLYLNFNDPTFIYSDNRFKETDANDGSIDDSKPVTIMVSGDTLTGENGEDFVASGKVKTNIDKVASGLTPVITRMSETELKVVLTGNATKHMNANDVDNLTFTFQDAALTSGDARKFANYQKKDLRINFKDPVLIYSTETFQEAAANDGSIGDSTPLTITVSGDTLTGTDDDDFVAAGKVQTNITRVASGLKMAMIRTSPTELQVTLTGIARNHADANNVKELMVKFKDKAFTSGKASKVEDYYKNDVAIDFTDAMLSYSKSGFQEAEADNGSIDNSAPLTITLSGDTLTGADGEDFVATGKVVTNIEKVAPGLKSVVTRTSHTELSVTLTGAATKHADAHDVDDLTLAFQNAAFTSGNAGSLIDAAKNDLQIDFSELALTYSQSEFKEVKANDGSIDNSKLLTITLTGDTLTGEDDEDFIATGKVKTNIEEVALGLTATVTRTNPAELSVALTGNATNHASINDVKNLILRFQDAALTLSKASNVANSAKSDLQIDFINPTLVYSKKLLKETDDANDGSVDNSEPMTITLTGDTWTGEDDEDFVATGKVVTNIEDVAPGLTAVVIRKNPTEVNAMLTNRATKHEKANSIKNLSLTFQDGAFTSGKATSVEPYAMKDLRINFSNPVLTYSKKAFKEASNDGSIDNNESMTITLTGDMLTGEDGEDFVAIGKIVTNISEVAPGLMPIVTHTSPTELQVKLTGNARRHANADDVKKLTFTFQDAAFTSEKASIVVNAAKSNLQIDFTDLALSYSKKGFKETAANDGSIDDSKPLKITLSGDTLSGKDGEDFVAAGKLLTNIDEVAPGLTAVVTRTSPTELKVTLTGKATNHTNTNDVFMGGAFRYSMDILVFIFFLLYVGYCRSCVRNLGEEPRAKFLLALVISIAVPLFVVPLFKYALLVPFPVEGGGIEVMNIFWYSSAIKAIRKVTGPYLFLLGVFLIFVAIIVGIYYKFMRKR